MHETLSLSRTLNRGSRGYGLVHVRRPASLSSRYDLSHQVSEPGAYHV
jgi:hypothetical protein